MSKAKYVALLAIVLAYFSHRHITKRQHNLPDIYGGLVDPAYKHVEEVFKSNFEDAWENEGASFAVMHKGKLIVDLWGGYADSTANRPWTRDTIAVVMSSTKAVASACIAILVDRGQLDYGKLVTDYWPEFGQHGKGNVTVKMLVSHMAGLAAFDGDITMESVRDSKKMSKLIENQKPNWPPGRMVGYHAITHGWLLDQLVRRSDPQKRSLGTFFKEEIATPYDINFHIGLPRKEFHRLARHTPPQLRQTIRRLSDLKFLKFMYSMITGDSGELLRKLLTNPSWYVNEEKGILGANNPEIMELEIPAANGAGNARSLAQLFNLFDSGKLTKSDKVLNEVRTPSVSTAETPAVYFAMIFNSTGHGFIHSPSPVGTWTYGHAGYGGQNVKVDTTNQLVYSYVTNGYSPDMGDMALRFDRLQTALYKCFTKR